MSKQISRKERNSWYVPGKTNVEKQHLNEHETLQMLQRHELNNNHEEFYNLLRRDEGKKYVRADAEYTKLYTKQLLDLWYSKTKEVLKLKRYFKKTKGYFIVNNPVEALDKTKGKSIISSSMTPKKNRS